MPNGINRHRCTGLEMRVLHVDCGQELLVYVSRTTACFRNGSHPESRGPQQPAGCRGRDPAWGGRVPGSAPAESRRQVRV